MKNKCMDNVIEKIKILYSEYEDLKQEIKYIDVLAKKYLDKDKDITLIFKDNDSTNGFGEQLMKAIKDQVMSQDQEIGGIFSFEISPNTMIRNNFTVDSTEALIILERILKYKKEKLKNIEAEIKGINNK